MCKNLELDAYIKERGIVKHERLEDMQMAC